MTNRNPFAPPKELFEPEFREVYDSAMSEARALVEEEAKKFKSQINARLEEFMKLDLAAEFQAEIDKERMAMDEEFAALRKTVSALNAKFKADLAENAVDVASLKANAEKLQTHAEDLKKAIDTAETKYNKLGNTLGAVVGTGVRKFLTGLLG